MATREELLAEAKRQQLLVQARQAQQQLAAQSQAQPTPTPAPSRQAAPVPQESDGVDWGQLGRRVAAPFRGAATSIMSFPADMADLRNKAVQSIPMPSGDMLP